MKKCILKLDVHDDKDKRKALKIVSTLPGIDAITMNMKDRTLTVIGSVDPINVVSKLRKFWTTDIISVGPAKEPEKKEEKKEDGKKEDGKKEEGKKEDGKKEEGKKDEAKKEDDGKKEDPKKKEEGKEEEKKSAPAPQPRMMMPYRPYYPPMNAYYNNYQPYQHNYQPPYHVNYQPQLHHSIEENPNACVIS